jgi:2-deoxy-D-gluconate 3-dehydrogenase
MNERGTIEMKDMFDLTGKKAIVTGGGKGLGKGIAEGFLEKGAEVVLMGSSDAVFKTCSDFQAKGYSAHAVQGDFLSREDRGRAFDEAIQLLGGTVDILVNNAGIQRRIPAECFPLDKWDEVIEVNLTAVFDLCQRAFPYMKANCYGKIINIGSLNCFRSVAKNIAAYQAAKSGILQVCKTLADEWSEFGIRTNGIAPGWVMTEMTAAVANDEIKYPQTLKQIPLGRWATPDDFKGITVLLASHAGDFINGTMIPVDGGFLSR